MKATLYKKWSPKPKSFFLKVDTFLKAHKIQIPPYSKNPCVDSLHLALPFELYLYKHHVSSAFYCEKSKSVGNIMLRFVKKKKKDGPPPHENFRLFRKLAIPCELDRQPYFKFHMEKHVLPTYRMMLRMMSFLGRMIVVAGPRNSRLFGSLCGVHKRKQHRNTLILISFDRDELRLVSCGIWV